MSEPILIPIKASEELPKEDGSYIIYNNKTGYDIYFFEVGWSEDFWLKRHQLWYKPISIDELLMSVEEIEKLAWDKFSDRLEYKSLTERFYQHYRDGAYDVINHIKSKLTEK